jgi:hypothetical protein
VTSSIRGNAEVAQKFRELAMLLKPMSKKSCRGSSAIHPRTRRCAWSAWRPGSAAALRARACATSPNTWPTKAATSWPRAEAEDFYRGVERLREDLDRLEARTRRLEDVEDEIPR